MKIAVIGAGAMGSIYGGHLSLQNEVWLVDTNQETVEHIQKNGLILQEEGQDITYHPSAVTSSEGLPPMDLVILFVKALYSQTAGNGSSLLNQSFGNGPGIFIRGNKAHGNLKDSG